MTTSNSSRRDPPNPNRDAPFLLTSQLRAPWFSELCDSQPQHLSAAQRRLDHCEALPKSPPRKVNLSVSENHYQKRFYPTELYR